ncbi:DMT family transporter [Devosia sp.]|uniref:DMT family transporter n=1 Tax=Devosia sp. TaxID=1871048 RepID=UPI0032670B61
MPTLSPNLRGILMMTAAMASFTINDSFLKVAMAGIPPYETLFLRSVVMLAAGVPLLAAMGDIKFLPTIVSSRVMGRNLFEAVGALGFIFALAYAPIADVTAISQLIPMLVLVGAVLFFGEKMSRMQGALVVFAFGGALLVAQPGGAGFSPFLLLGFWNAAAIATRDLLGRRIGAEIPGLVVAMGAGLTVLVGAGVGSLLLEKLVMPDVTQLGLLLCSGLFVMLAHWLVFTSFRTASVGAVVPFIYTQTIWALIAGALVFHTVPNLLAGAGIAVIVISGVAVVLSERRRQKSLLQANLP